MTQKFDVTIIGAGIVGLATALQLSWKSPNLKIAIADKEDIVAKHQTGHNSGVIHSGIYYKPGSLRATNCQKGYQYLLDFCEENDVDYEICGKVIVATKEEERGQLDVILDRGLKNGMAGIHKISPQEVKEKEPYVQSVEGIWVPQAGIVNYGDVARKYAELFLKNGGNIFNNTNITNITLSSKEVIIETNKGEISTDIVVNCAGLYSDKIAKMTGQSIDFQILPFRGEYYELKPEKQYLVNNLIYPVPNPDFPFLGVHYTRMIKGGIEAGPNAVLAFKREGYNRYDFNFAELTETLAYPGFRKLAIKYWREGLDEMYRSYSKSAFVKALQHLIPEVTEADLQRGGAGVRAMACGRNGEILDDYVIYEKSRVINVCNAPSPAATSSLSIGETIAEKVLKQVK